MVADADVANLADEKWLYEELPQKAGLESAGSACAPKLNLGPHRSVTLHSSAGRRTALPIPIK
jgi:hypothetical protein